MTAFGQVILQTGLQEQMLKAFLLPAIQQRHRKADSESPIRRCKKDQSSYLLLGGLLLEVLAGKAAELPQAVSLANSIVAQA